jgi:hypothetical protein
MGDKTPMAIEKALLRETDDLWTAMFDGSKLSSGLYYVRMSSVPYDGSKTFMRTMKIVLEK